MKRLGIEVLPDDALLEIFYFYVNVSPWGKGKREIEAWQSLVHVCRRWRSLVFQSPCRLNLRLFCTLDTPVKDKLDIWPALPLVVWGDMTSSPSGIDNVVAALGHSNRVCEVDLWGLARGEAEEVLAAMQVPFPELTDLQLSSRNETLSFMVIDIPIPDSFLGGSAPRLRHVNLCGIPSPGLSKLLLSATHLVSLRLTSIPHSGYISPEAMAALLSVSSSLERLILQFQSLQSHPDLESRSLPPLKRTILPALHQFLFYGVTEYLEELVTRIDTPQLNEIHLIFVDQIDSYCPRLAQFIHRTPTFGARDNAYVQLGDSSSGVILLAQSGTLEIEIPWEVPDRQLLSVAQVCNSFLHLLSTVEDLYIERQYGEQVFQIDAIENTQWLQLLLPFTAVETLSLSKEFAPGIAATLQELVGGRITEVLPSLQNIFVEWPRNERRRPCKENFEQFVAARQLSGHPIALSVRDEDSDMDSEST